MFIRKIFLLVLFLTKFSFSQQKKEVSDYANTITSKELMENLYVYSSDYFQGRETGTIGQKRAVNFLKDFYIRSGIISARGTNNYFQPMILNIKGKIVETENVAAIIQGSKYPEEYIILTAHLDHIGIDKNGFINNGADDDGTGNVALLEIAEAFIKAKNEGVGPKRSLVFLHVTGEEKGLLGSKYYTENPLYPLKNTVANLNIDMIGRINPKRNTDDPNYIYLIGSDKLSEELHDISKLANERHVQLELDYTYNDDNDPNRFYYRSDHYNFAKKNIPVIFYFSGTHEDYHKPTDTADKINYSILEKRTKLIFYTAWELANRSNRIKLNR
jgi:Zn-dependent M28 family amino/carboxypeptidase